MKRILTLLLFVTLAVASVFGQTRKEKKAIRKAEQDSIQQEMYLKAVAGVMDTLIILQADQVFDKRGRSVNVDSHVNFVKFAKDQGVVQLSFPFLMGPNGIGGVTVEGRLAVYEVEQDEKGRIFIKANTFGGSLNADIFITLYPGTNNAEATVTASTLPYRVLFSGEILHLYDSEFYEATPLF